MTLPSVSVVIPCYNAARFVEDAVRSVWAQTVLPSEIVCVDDGSRDDTLARLRRLAADSPVPMHVLTGPNGGAAHARNRGTARATGDYVQYLDADDILLPGKLAHQLNLVASSAVAPDLVMAAFHEEPFEGGAPRLWQPDPNPWIGLIVSRWGITSANLWRREKVLRVGGWDPAWPTSEDVLLVFRILQAEGTVLLDLEPLTRKRVHSNSLYRSDPEGNRERWWALRWSVIEHVVQHEELDAAQRRRLAALLLPKLRWRAWSAPDEAAALHELAVRGWVGPAEAGLGRHYALAYRVLGFRGAARLERLLHRVQRVRRRWA